MKIQIIVELIWYTGKDTMFRNGSPQYSHFKKNFAKVLKKCRKCQMEGCSRVMQKQYFHSRKVIYFLKHKRQHKTKTSKLSIISLKIWGFSFSNHAL